MESGLTSKLFTRSELERAARLSVGFFVAQGDPEAAITRAVTAIAQESPAYYDEPTVRKMLDFAWVEAAQFESPESLYKAAKDAQL